MKHPLTTLLKAAIFCGGALSAPLISHGQSSQPPLLGFDFQPSALSGDGKVVLSNDKGGSLIWTWADGTSRLGAGLDLGEEDYIYGNALSRTGRFMVGSLYLSELEDRQAFILDRTSNDLITLGAGEAYDVEAMDVTDAGDLVIGYGDYSQLEGPWFSQALLWQGDFEEPIILGSLDEELTSARALAVDGEGTRAVGYAFENGSETPDKAVYWDLDGAEPAAIEIEGLGDGGFYSRAQDISRNGKFIVGTTGTETGNRGFIFTDDDGANLIPLIDDEIFTDGQARAVSNNGVVVGNNRGERGIGSIGTTDLPDVRDTAYIYDDVHGTRSIAAWLEDSGVEVGEWNFADATGISEDGKVVVGTTGRRRIGPIPVADGELSPEDAVGFIAREGSGAIIPEDFMGTLGAGQAPSAAAFNLLNLSMHGAHHVPLQMMGANRHAWVTGDFARYDDSDVNSGLGEVGAAIDLFNQQLVAGLGIGQSWISQEFARNGDMDMDGYYVLSELSFKPTKLPLVFTITGAVGNWEADIDRHYINAGLGDSSEGSTDVLSSTLRFRVDWLDIVKVGGFGITPKIEYTVNYTKADAYTESGGGFPVAYDEQSHTAQEVRYGLTASRQLLQDKALLRLRVEGVHRFDETGASAGGQVIGLFDFNLPGQQIQQDWALFGIDFVYALSEKVTLNTSVSTSTTGEDPVFGGSVGLQVKF